MWYNRTTRTFKCWYDANGNQVTRVVGSNTYGLSYDAENRLVGVTKNGTGIATFVYGPGGERVKGTVNGVTTVYVENHYEKQGTTVRKYYYAGAQRVAMRENGVLYWLLVDHLGSTAIVANASGAKVGEVRYKAWGEERYASGTIPTTYRYTGQRWESGIGLYFYNARWYDPALGRFVQPDTVVSEPGDPQNFNRFAYVRNNPMRFCDPFGHCAGDPNDPSNPDVECWKAYYQSIGILGNDFAFLAGWRLAELNRLLAWLGGGIRFTGKWLSSELSSVLGILDEYAETFGRERFAELLRRGVVSQTGGTSQNLVFHRERTIGGLPAGWYNTQGRIVLWNELFDPGLLQGSGYMYMYPSDFRKSQSWILGHEIGHVLLDGLRPRSSYWYFEDAYRRTVSHGHWPHANNPMESLATEFALLVVLDETRPADVQEFWKTHLWPVIHGPIPVRMQ